MYVTNTNNTSDQGKISATCFSKIKRLLLKQLIFLILGFLSKECTEGFYGNQPICQECPYPTYGAGCQSNCDCDQELCNHVKGCTVYDISTGTCICFIQRYELHTCFNAYKSLTRYVLSLI